MNEQEVVANIGVLAGTEDGLHELRPQRQEGALEGRIDALSSDRWGLWALPVWSILLFLSTLTHQPDPETEFGEFARYVTTTQFRSLTRSRP